MGLVLPTIDAYHVHHLPIVQAYADKMGLVEVINQLGATELASAPGPIVLGMSLDPLRGRNPLSRVEECLTHHDTALLLGKAVVPSACDDDTVGRVLERLSDTGTMQLYPACAVRAAQVFHFDKRSVHFATTSVSVSGDYLPSEDQQGQQEPAAPCTMPPATFLAQQGIAPWAASDVAAAALVTEAKLAALGATLFIPRLPATERAGG